MVVPTPESLSMDCGLKCDMCKESVNYGDDYIAHLQFAHSVTQNIPFFMNKALAKIKGEKRKIADVVTIEEEFSEESIRSNEEGVADTLVLDANTKENIERTVERTMDDLFKGIRSLLDGKEPLESMEDDTRVMDNDDDDPSAADEKIWQSFENLKEIVNNIEFPIELLKQLAASSSSNNEIAEESFDPTTTTEDTLEELVAPPPKEPEEETAPQFRNPPSKKKSLTVKAAPLLVPSPSPTPPLVVSSVQSSRPAPVSKPSHQNMNSATKLVPVKSDQSDASSNAGQTYFLCPLQDCTFSTNKQGMLDGAAAKHLNLTHKITGANMKAAAPGAYKFKKVKGEKKV